jgi:hypothetical protein
MRPTIAAGAKISRAQAMSEDRDRIVNQRQS